MTELNPSYGGPFVHKTNQVSPQDVMWRIMRKHPKAANSRIMKLFREEILDDSGLVAACIDAIGINCKSSIDRLRRENAERISPEAQRQRQLARTQLAKKIEVVAAKVKDNFIVAWAMASTFRDVEMMAKKAPQLSKLAKMGKPAQNVADVLDEAAVRKVIDGK